jgi:hypothetical protein
MQLSIDIDNNDLEDSDFDEALFKEQDLMTTTEPGPRIFTLANEKATTLLGYVLIETGDSFLVALPSRLLEVEGVKQIQAFIEVPYCRLQKTSVSMVIPMFGEFKQYFDKYIREEGAKRYPGMAEDIEIYLASVDPEPVKEELTEEQKQSREQQRRELAEKLAEADSKGAVLTDMSPTKH